MTLREVGLGVQGDKAPGEYAAIAAAAERHGFDAVSVYGDLGFQPPLPALLEMAGASDHIRLGPACLNPYTLHPYEIAGQAAALERAAPGRSYLGLARGSWLDRIGIRQHDPVRRLEEAVAVVRALLAGDGSGYDGTEVRLTPGTRLAYPLPDRTVPLLIGGWGPRTLALAGRVGDEVKIGGSANPDLIAVMTERIAVGEVAAGRAPGTVSLVVGAVTVVDEDREVARALARTEVAMYLDVVAGLDPTFEVDPDLLDAVRGRLDEGDHASAGAQIPDAVLDRFAFSGTPEDVAAQAGRLYAAGADRVEFGTPHGLDSMRGIDLLGTAVLPRLRA